MDFANINTYDNFVKRFYFYYVIISALLEKDTLGAFH